MRLTKSQLLNLPVETTAGRQLGRISDVVLETEGQSVVQYHVKSSHLVPGLFEQKLIVNRSQVVSLTDEKMVVEESTDAAAEGATRSVPRSEKAFPVPTRS